MRRFLKLRLCCFAIDSSFQEAACLLFLIVLILFAMIEVRPACMMSRLRRQGALQPALSIWKYSDMPVTQELRIPDHLWET